jgi:hypothetical protein
MTFIETGQVSLNLAKENGIFFMKKKIYHSCRQARTGLLSLFFESTPSSSTGKLSEDSEGKRSAAFHIHNHLV